MKGIMTKKQITSEGIVIARSEASVATEDVSECEQSHRWGGLKNGFTLIEMLVSIVVLAVGIMAVAGVFPLSLRVAQNMKAITKGTAYAHQTLEELRTIPFNDAALTAGTHPAIPETLEDRYYRQYRVDDDTPITGMKRIRVLVKWQYPSPDSVVIYTYLTRN